MEDDVNPFSEQYKPQKKSAKKRPRKLPDIDLTEEQKKEILAAPKDADLMDITRKVFNNPKLDGRSKEGRVVRSFLSENDKTYETKVFKAGEKIELNPDQKEFIETRARAGDKPFQIAKTLFESAGIQVKPLSREYRAVDSYIKNELPDFVDEATALVESSYNPPKTFKQMLSKINDVTKLGLEEGKLNTKVKKCVQTALTFVQIARFVIYANTLGHKQERDLFEAEFVGTVWNKPDLTRDELNLCFNLCQEYIKQHKIDKAIVRLEEIHDTLVDDNDGKMSMSIIENIKNHREDHKKSVELQRKLSIDLNGSRQKRMEQKKEGSRSISQFVEFVQEEENRELLKKMLEIKKQLLAETIQDYKDSSELVAMVYGVEEEDILEWE